MESISQVAPAIAMLGAVACVVGGIATIRRGDDRRKGALMLVMAAVLVGNVLVWTL